MKLTYKDFTILAQDAILHARKVAKDKHHQAITTLHLLKGILYVDEHWTKRYLELLEVDPARLSDKINVALQRLPKVKTEAKQYLDQTINASLKKAYDLLGEFGDEYISLEVLLLSMSMLENDVSTLLAEEGVTSTEVRQAIKHLRGGQKVESTSAESTYQVLDKFAIDLTERAAKGLLDPIVGRDEEMRRIMHILSRRKKNNPMLVGPAGVGKTAVVEALAMRIHNEDVPDRLLDKRIYMLDMASLVAGAKYKGEFEERLKSVIQEVRDAAGEIIVFIDEVHTLIGAGNQQGAMDAANILKPALARGEFRMIGATTHDEYQKHILRDKALVRRFQTVDVEEPSVDMTVSILRGIQERYETFHQIAIRDDALVAAAQLSHRYIADRALPDKAIDLMDEAASRLRMELDSMPEELDELSRQIKILELEVHHLEAENNQEQLSEVKEVLARSQSQYDHRYGLWEREHQLMVDTEALRLQIVDLDARVKAAEADGQLEQAAKMKYEERKTIQSEFEAKQAELEGIPEGERFIHHEVTADDVAEVVARWTGIPVTRMLKTEKDRLLHLEERIGERLIGQTEAVKAVSDAVRRSRAGLQDGQRPIGSFIFLGPTGVGKTELAKTLAELLFDDEEAIVRIDMSEYQERHSVSKLVGAPPGYVGYDEGGQLTEAVRRKPYSIVLLDEIEKAHPDTFNMLLQVLDDGRLTDNRGEVIDFKNTIIIMTSNMAAEVILENFEDLEYIEADRRQEVIDTTKTEVFEQLKEQLRPEFLNRIDERIMFLPLTKEEIKKIAGLLMKKLVKNISARGMRLEVMPSAMTFIADKGYDPQFGARPLKRVIQRELTNQLAKELLQDTYAEGDTIYVADTGRKLTFSKTPPSPAAQVASDQKEDDERSQARKAARRDKDVRRLEKATDELNDAIQEIKASSPDDKDAEAEDRDAAID